MIGDNIVKIRKSKGMSLSLCAKKIGISSGYLSDIENNIKKNPSVKVLNKISFVFEIPISELLSTEEKLDIAMGSLKEIRDTISHYQASKSNVDEIELDAETNLFINKLKKLSKKDRMIVEVLVGQLLKEE